MSFQHLPPMPSWIRSRRPAVSLSNARHLAAMACLAATLHAGAHAATPASDPRGRWITASGNLEVEVAPCGEALCGKVSRVLGNRSMARGDQVMAPVDTRPALGMTLLYGFTPADPLLGPHAAEAETASAPGDASATWQGLIYNRENGKTYRCLMSVDTRAKPAGELVLRAYVGIPLFGKTQRWQRVGAGPVGQPLQPSAQP